VIGVRGRVFGVAAAALLGAGAAHALATSAALPTNGQPSATGSVSPWLALAALSHQVDTPERLCYWDFRDERWIPADGETSVERM